MRFILAQEDVIKVGSIKLTIPFQRVLDLQTNKEIKLTPNEFKLLFVLLTNYGNPVTRQHLIECIWPSTRIQERVLDSHVSDLRKKLKGAGHKIENIRGIGYQFRMKDAKG